MGVIATLTVDLVANSAKLKKSLIKAQKSAEKFATSVRSSMAAAGKSMAVMGAATTAALTALYTRSATTNDVLAKTADKLGLTTEALAGLRHQAELNGISQRTLDVGLQRMARRLSEAEKGTGVAVKALQELGVGMDQLKGKSPDAQFKVIADSFEQVSSQSDKVRLSFALFDSDGVGLVNAMRGGTAAINAAQEEALALGIALNRIDTAKFELANDNMDRAAKAATGVGNRIALEFTPYVSAAGKAFTEAAIKSGGFAETIADVVEVSIEGVAQIANVVHRLNLAWETGKLGIASYAAWVTDKYLAIYDTIRAAHDALPEWVRGEDMERSESLEFMAKSTAASLKQARLDVQEAGRAEFPADAIRAKAQAIREEAQKAAQDAAKAAEDAIAGGGGQESIQDPKLTAKIEAFKLGAEKLAEMRLQEEGKVVQLEQARYDRERAKELADYDALIAAGANKEQIEVDHLNRMEDIRVRAERRVVKAREAEKKNLTALQKFNAKGAKDQTKQVLGEALTLSQGLAQNSKTMFKVNKIAGIASATISTYEGVTKTLGAYPQPLASILAAGHLAAGLAQIAAIKGTTFQGGSSGASVPAAPSVTGSVAAPGEIAQLNDLQSGSSQEEQAPNINIYVDNLGDLSEDELADRLRGAMERDLVVIGPGTEQYNTLKGAA